MQDFTPSAIRGADTGYVAFHAPRFAYLLEYLQTIGLTKESRVLDIGPSLLTDLIRRRFAIPVDTLGFAPDSDSPQGRHYQFDLNHAQHEAEWRRDLPRYDVIVMAEVIEHIYTAPELVLAFLRTLLVPGGCLVIQTPNAAAFPKRVKLLIGRNPYERIRLDNTNPGHFREYTVRELDSLATGAGFDVIFNDARFYFDARYAHHGPGGRPDYFVGRIKNLVFPLLPRFLRHGLTVVARRR